MPTPRGSAGVRRATVVSLVTVLASMLPATGASAARDPLADAQAGITAAQEAADEAVAAYDAAQARYYELQRDSEVTRKTIASLRATQQLLAGDIRDRAVTLYIQAGETGLGEVFSSSSDVLDGARHATLAEAANANDGVAIGRLRATTEDLDLRQDSLRSQLAGARNALADIRSQQQALQRALDDARQAEQELRARLERERRANEYAARLRKARADAPSPSDSPSDSPISDDTPRIIGSDDWVCPVQGAVSFTSTYGAPRGNGRTHKGVDMFAATGTPTVAVVAGSVFFQGDTLGGLAAYVNGNDGNTYYYAHLDDYVGGGRSVSAGELIGHVGNTGATDAPPHLHFEIRPGGASSIGIDPYPTVRSHC